MACLGKFIKICLILCVEFFREIGVIVLEYIRG